MFSPSRLGVQVGRQPPEAALMPMPRQPLGQGFGPLTEGRGFHYLDMGKAGLAACQWRSLSLSSCLSAFLSRRCGSFQSGHTSESRMNEPFSSWDRAPRVLTETEKACDAVYPCFLQAWQPGIRAGLPFPGCEGPSLRHQAAASSGVVLRLRGTVSASLPSQFWGWAWHCSSTCPEPPRPAPADGMPAHLPAMWGVHQAAGNNCCSSRKHF